MYIIAGLGNPEKKYEWTRHNSGFAALNILAEMSGIPVETSKFQGLCGSGVIGGQKVLLVKPQTYMNLSGVCIAQACSFYKIDPARELIVLYDDISLPPGQLRIRGKGSAGGHNGIKNIIGQLGTMQFMRVKIGVGEKPSGYDLADWVLGKFPLSMRADMTDAYDRAAHAAQALMTEPMDRVMNRYNASVGVASKAED